MSTHLNMRIQEEEMSDPERETTCDFCTELFLYRHLRICQDCESAFCLDCAPPLQTAVLQCCNYHGLVLWYCSDSCRAGHSASTVRLAYAVEDNCAD